MKQSEITVSMPMTAFRELEEAKKNYDRLSEKLNECFSLSSENRSLVFFDQSKALEICKEFLPYRYKDCDIASVS